MICHITTQAAWETGQASGQFRSPEFDDFGFIHCSTPEQLPLVANAFFAGRSGLVLLVIDEAKLKSPVRWEPPHAIGPLPGFTIGSFFPHVYGPINVDSVVRAVPLVPNDRGAFIMPTPA
ncbi:MAG TPA: DUF952 domain-containing protein [Steroidobacteraceae bacterium]|nr:DUF952 domain-containing protein [Steroidobacteraceae bacterium]